MNQLIFKNTIVVLISLVAFFGCKKISPKSTSTGLNIEKIKTDVDFKLYVNEIDSIKHHLSSRLLDSILSENDFIKYYIKAIKENDINAKRIISKQMGYNEFDYWSSRSRRIEVLRKLNLKYDLSKVEKSDFIIHNYKKTLSYDTDECVEIYKICKDNVTATYAMDQITCVTAGALGFTGIGVIVFVGCEAAAVYRMYLGDRNCSINFKYCK